MKFSLIYGVYISIRIWGGRGLNIKHPHTLNRISEYKWRKVRGKASNRCYISLDLFENRRKICIQQYECTHVPRVLLFYINEISIFLQHFRNIIREINNIRWFFVIEYNVMRWIVWCWSFVSVYIVAMAAAADTLSRSIRTNTRAYVYETMRIV